MMKPQIWLSALLLWGLALPAPGNVVKSPPTSAQWRQWKITSPAEEAGAITVNDYAGITFLPANSALPTVPRERDRPSVDNASQGYGRTPEPGSVALFGLGLLGLALVRRQLKD